MLTASELRAGLAVRIDGALYKILDVVNHAGQGKMGGFTHARLQNIETGTTRERRFRLDEAVEEIVPERRTLQFLYKDEAFSHFMDPETFEQVDIENERLGRAAAFLTESMVVPIDLVAAQAVGIVMPDVIEVKVIQTAPASRSQGGQTVWKEAVLENGLKIMLPPFIAPGETIRMDVERGTYIERAHKGR